MLFLSILLFYEPSNLVQTASKYNLIFTPRTLYWGVQGQDVKTVQDKLLRWRFYDGVVDGIYGARTYRAVRKFQAKHGLNVDGVVGPTTAKALGMPTVVEAASTQGINRNADEYQIGRASCRERV